MNANLDRGRGADGIDDIFVPAEDPRPVPAVPTRPARSKTLPVARPAPAAPEPAYAAASPQPDKQPNHSQQPGGGGLILPPGIRSLASAEPGAAEQAPKVWAPSWSGTPAPHGELDDDYYADDLDQPAAVTPAQHAGTVGRPTEPPPPPPDARRQPPDPRRQAWPPAPAAPPATPPPWVAAPVPQPPPRPAARSSRRGLVPQRPPRVEREPRPEVDWRGNAVLSDLTSESVLRPRPVRPSAGWRRTLFDLSGGRWSPGLGAAASARADRCRRIQRPLRGSHRIAVLSVKGGVGKTTVAAMLGLTFAEIRGDRVLAIDANPDLGTLADRLTGDAEVGMQHLLDFLSDRPAFTIADIEHFVSSTSRLQVLAGSQEPCHGSAFTPEEYEEAIEALSSCYNVMIIDTGTGLSHSALAGVLATAHNVVIVGEPTVDAASRASMTLDWLAGSGYAELAANAIVVMSQDRGSSEIDHTVIQEHFGPRCAAVVEVPADPHLALGARIHLTECRAETAEAFEELAAAIADTFPEPGPRRRIPEAH